jgi:hypothetical protein
MLETPSRETFIPLLNSQFQVGPVAVELVEVSELRSSRNSEAFSLVFRGPRASPLPQAVYRFYHADVGELDIFIVPIGQEDSDLFYEAVFNTLRPKERA